MTDPSTRDYQYLDEIDPPRTLPVRALCVLAFGLALLLMGWLGGGGFTLGTVGVLVAVVGLVMLAQHLRSNR